jgi:hypothetical protein
MVRVIKTEYSDVVIISEGIKGNAPFVIPLTELDALYYDLFKIRSEYREQIDKAIEHKKKQTEEIMKLIEPQWESARTVEVKQTPINTQNYSAGEFNENWTAFEKDLTPAERAVYLELSQGDKTKAFNHWMRTGGEHIEYHKL